MENLTQGRLGILQSVNMMFELPICMDWFPKFEAFYLSARHFQATLIAATKLQLGEKVLSTEFFENLRRSANRFMCIEQY